MAEVTRRDREAAAAAVTPGLPPTYTEGNWIEYGDEGVGYIPVVMSRVAKAIADARAASSAEVTRLEREVERLGQAVKYWQAKAPSHPGGGNWCTTLEAPTVASAELERDLAVLRKLLPTWRLADHTHCPVAALSRIAVALGVKL